MKLPSDHPQFEVCLDLEIGDTVLIEGRGRARRAVVIAVIREDDDPRKCLPAGYRAPRSGYGQPRDRRSFLVRRGHGRIAYWPRTAAIKPLSGT